MMNRFRTLLVGAALCFPASIMAAEPVADDAAVQLVITAQMRPHFDALKQRLEADPAYAPDGVLTDAQVMNILAFGGWVQTDSELRTTLSETSILRITKITGAMPYDLARSWVGFNQAMVQACGDSQTKTRVKIKMHLSKNGEIETLDVMGARPEQAACVTTQIQDWTLAPRVEGTSEIELYVLYAVPTEMREFIARTTPESLSPNDRVSELPDTVATTHTTHTTAPEAGLQQKTETPTQAVSRVSVGFAFTTAISMINQQDAPGGQIQGGLAFMPMNFEIEPMYSRNASQKIGVFWKYQPLPFPDEFREEEAFSGPCLGGECVFGARFHQEIDEAISVSAALGFGKTRKMVRMAVLPSDPRCTEPAGNLCWLDNGIRDGWFFPEIGVEYAKPISDRVRLVGMARANMSMPDVAINLHLGVGTHMSF